MVDTFSGIGGFSLAAEWTGSIRPVQFIEIDPWCRRVLAKHWPGVPIHDDIKTFLANAEGDAGKREQGQWSRIRDEFAVNGTERSLDLITGGFPCQPFSQAGKQGGANDDRYLWPELARLVAALRPRWCLFENVFGIVNMAGGLERVWADLEAIGYEVGAVVIPAAAVGAPHKRDRVWIVAHDVSESDAERRGRRQDHEGQASPERDGYSQAGDVADAAQRGLRRGSAPGQPGQLARGSEDAAHPDGQGESTGTVDGGAGRGQLWPRDDWNPHIIHEASLARARRGADPQPEGNRQRFAGTEALSSVGLETHGLSRLVDGRFAPRPFGPDWEDGIPRVTTHEEDRVSKLKALGNSIVPQVAYELMLMMLTVDDAMQAEAA